MAVEYTVSERGSLLNPSQPKKWYANAKSTGNVALRALGKKNAQRSTVNPADTQTVLVALTEDKIVRWGNFGAFQVNVSSEGAETEAKFNAAQIKGGKVVFRPEIVLKEIQNNLKYERA
ncbi:DNA-binding protein [Candidatus Symbiothrix dinenymphae]|nr:DNA-binding protein [Candidatus Symbiothrix dinenymphae]